MIPHPRTTTCTTIDGETFEEHLKRAGCIMSVYGWNQLMADPENRHLVVDEQGLAALDNYPDDWTPDEADRLAEHLGRIEAKLDTLLRMNGVEL